MKPLTAKHPSQKLPKMGDALLPAADAA